ncbi:glutathione S-transferase family protein [Motiliproteus sp. SC1-56]|uniref:glutathione S-transferase family protein n=1 Tax=Motiliproteus sp. SC1-56 TaxID=2799565 RepID=UPI001A906B0B|nr:glutathione S-transferase N-terminal domain-containing protein [Motiliproteus sp. SC1-56]
MKLFLNKTSPYARMARIVMLEKGLSDQVALCWCDPWGEDEQLLAANPVGRIPVLVTDSGNPLSESMLIAFYLNDLPPGPSLVPENRKEAVLHLAGLGQGLMDASFTMVISRKYLNTEVNDSVLDQRRWRAIDRTLERLEHCIDSYSLAGEITLGDISVAVALEYLGFRLPELNTPDKYPNLEAWRNTITRRSSFTSTTFS